LFSHSHAFCHLEKASNRSLKSKDGNISDGILITPSQNWSLMYIFVFSLTVGVVLMKAMYGITLKQLEVCFVTIAKHYDSYFVMVVFDSECKKIAA
jgi:hypothetical protein